MKFFLGNFGFISGNLPFEWGQICSSREKKEYLNHLNWSSASQRYPFSIWIEHTPYVHVQTTWQWNNSIEYQWFNSLHLYLWNGNVQLHSILSSTIEFHKKKMLSSVEYKTFQNCYNINCWKKHVSLETRTLLHILTYLQRRKYIIYDANYLTLFIWRIFLQFVNISPPFRNFEFEPSFMSMCCIKSDVCAIYQWL